jgi:hypothetical protein
MNTNACADSCGLTVALGLIGKLAPRTALKPGFLSLPEAPDN